MILSKIEHSFLNDKKKLLLAKVRFWLLVISLFTQPLLMAAEEAPLSISELVGIGLENNPETKTAWLEVQKKAAEQSYINSDYHPSISLTGDLINGRDYRFANSNEVSYTTAGANLVFSYLVFDFGEREANDRAATALLLAANWHRNAAMQDVAHAVLTHTYKYLNAIELLESNLESLHDAQMILESVEELHRIGLKSITDLYTVRTSYSQAQMEVARKRSEVDVAYNKLLRVLGLNAEAKIDIAHLPDPIALSGPKIAHDPNLLLQIAKQQRADLIAKRMNIMEKQAQIKRSRAEYLPKIRFNGNGGYNRYFHDSSNGLTYRVGLFFEYPLFDGFSESAQSKIVSTDLQKARIDLERKELDVAEEICNSSRLFETAQEILILSKEHLHHSLASFEGTLERYNSGTQSVFDLNAAQKALAFARVQNAKAKSDWYTSLAQLAYATGNVMSYMEAACINSE